MRAVYKGAGQFVWSEIFETLGYNLASCWDSNLAFISFVINIFGLIVKVYSLFSLVFSSVILFIDI